MFIKTNAFDFEDFNGQARRILCNLLTGYTANIECYIKHKFQQQTLFSKHYGQMTFIVPGGRPTVDSER